MRLLKKHDIEDILFIDIETAHADYGFNQESPLYDAWHYDHMREVETDQELVDLYMKSAPLYAEFGRIACITLGVVRENKIILRTFSNSDEKVLLEEMMDCVEKVANNKTVLCGHNILDFDIPFVMRRSIINRVPLHILFDTAHLKPWETSALDTAVLWKSTAWKKQSFLAVSSALGLPSSKDDISGKDVGHLYWAGGIDRIVTYCEKDVSGTVNLFRAFRYEDPLEVGEQTQPEQEGILSYLFYGGAYTKEVEEKLSESLSKLNKLDRLKALEIIGVLPTKAKGKETDITKADIKKLV